MAAQSARVPRRTGRAHDRTPGQTRVLVPSRISHQDQTAIVLGTHPPVQDSMPSLGRPASMTRCHLGQGTRPHQAEATE